MHQISQFQLENKKKIWGGGQNPVHRPLPHWRLEALAGTRGTDSQLDGTDIDNNLVLTCLYCLKCTECGQLILREL